MREAEAVLVMQDYICAHYKDENFNTDSVCSAVGYSRRQNDRHIVIKKWRFRYSYNIRLVTIMLC